MKGQKIRRQSSAGYIQHGPHFCFRKGQDGTVPYDRMAYLPYLFHGPIPDLRSSGFDRSNDVDEPHVTYLSI